MTPWEALGLGVLQGATEFLPISSSGHLALAQAWLGRESDSGLLFNVIVHLGTLFAVVLVLRQRLWGLVRGALSFVFGGERDAELETNRRWVLWILVASVPTALIGLGLRDVVIAISVPAVGGALVCTGFLLISAERFGGRTRGAADLGLRDALVVGVAQGLGVIPGISRSGVTIAPALWLGVRADVAVEFSILVSVPAIVGANLLEVARAGEALGAELLPLALGFVAAFAVGAASLRALQWVVVRRRLLPFAVYVILLGGGVMLLG